MRSRPTLSILLPVLAALLLGRSDAAACSCLARPVEGKLAESAVVFQGTVVASRPLRSQGGVDLVVRYTFEVARVWKGGRIGTIDISAGTSSAACGITFDIGREYVVYATGDTAEGFSTNLCAGNFQADQEYATTEITELDRLAGNSSVAGERPVSAGIDVGYLLVRNDEIQIGNNIGIWVSYDFTPTAFMRAFLDYGRVDTAISSPESSAIARSFYHGSLEAGMRLFRRERSSGYLVLGALVGSGTSKGVSSSGDPVMSLLSAAPVVGLGVDAMFDDHIIVMAEYDAAFNLGGDLPEQAFRSVYVFRAGAGWRF